MKTKYTLIEIIFSDRWQWVRRISNQCWVKEHGERWVKFSDEELSHYKNKYDIDLTTKRPDKQVEDWRLKNERS